MKGMLLQTCCLTSEKTNIHARRGTHRELIDTGGLYSELWSGELLEVADLENYANITPSTRDAGLGRWGHKEGYRYQINATATGARMWKWP